MELKNKIFINILFFLFLILGFFSLIFLMHTNNDKIFIPFYGKVNSNIRVNVEISKENLKNFNFYINSAKIKPKILIPDNTYVYYEEKLPSHFLYFKLKNTNTLNDIKSIIISEGRNFYYYSNDDIKNFKHNKKGEYFFPSDIKYMKSSKYINDKGFLHKISAYYLSFFYNTNLYIIPLIFFLLSVLIYLLNKEKFNSNFTFLKNKTIWIIILSAILTRLSSNGAPFWGDELYTSTVASGINRPFAAVFQDPGNPPLFFILAKIWIFIFGSNEAICRILPSVFSILSIYILYIFVKRNTKNKNYALLSSFILSYNVLSIHYANDFRAYSFMGFLCLLSAYFLFEIVKYRKTKDFIMYAIISCFMANTHYFQILFLLSNFILGIFLLDNKSRIKFLHANLFAIISFLPFFLITALDKGLLDSNFNNYDICTLSTMWYIFSFYFKNKVIAGIILISALLIGIKKVKEEIFEKKEAFFNIYIYFFYSIFMLFALSYIFSISIKPIIKAYYFMGILPFVCALIGGLFFIPFKNKLLKALVLFYILMFSVFSINGKNYFIDSFGNNIIRLEELFKYQNYDTKRYNNQKIALAIFDYPNQYINFYKNYINKNNVIILDYKFANAKSDEILNKFKKSNADIIYIMLHATSFKNYTKEFLKEYDLSVIITDEDVICAKLIKR